MFFGQRTWATILLLYSVFSAYAFSTGWSLKVDSLRQWEAMTDSIEGASVMAAPEIGDRFDLMGPGSLLLEKTDTQKKFWKVTNFKSSGTWTSQWHVTNDKAVLDSVVSDLLVYGKQVNLDTGWVKFSGNPLICANNWHHATNQTLQLPANLSDWPQDQSLVRGRGKFEGKWLVIFNIGAWAVKGWGAAVADSLSPLKGGTNPFKLADPYPFFVGTGGNNAPNDWIFAEGLWFGPDETNNGPSHMWTSPDLITWTNAGKIENIVGHDPGMLYDGEQYYLINENGEKLRLCTAETGLGPWNCDRDILDAKDHTGDADFDFFNNRWHMFFDNNPHTQYTLGYASTSAESFPDGWQNDLHTDMFGPKKPDQGQAWDEWGSGGNSFGTGDCDFALEDMTLYITYERPVGLAYRELSELLSKDNGQSVKVMVEIDSNGDSIPNDSTGWHEVTTGTDVWKSANGLKQLEGKRFRIKYSINSNQQTESPMIRRFCLELSPSSPIRNLIRYNSVKASTRIFKVADNSIILPQGLKGHLSLQIYDLSGRLLGKINAKGKRKIDLNILSFNATGLKLIKLNQLFSGK